MKKFLLLCILFAACFSAKAQTNIYHPFPVSNANWNHWSIQYWGCSVWQDYQEWMSVVISGDTVIANTTYHKLSIPYIQKNCINGGVHFAGYHGAFREDTSLKKVFFVNRLDSTEQLLYDFTMEVGDTVKGYLVNQAVWGCWTIDNRIVTSIDSVLVGSDYRKRWQIHSSPIYFIEGIGSTAGLLDPVCDVIDGPQVYTTCFSHNGSVLYPYNVTSCDVITDITEVNSKTTFSISVVPNPFHTSAQLEIKSEKLDRYRGKNFVLKIYNTLGTLVSEEGIKDLDTYFMTRGALHDGIYFYDLRTLNHESLGSGKFIVN